MDEMKMNNNTLLELLEAGQIPELQAELRDMTEEKLAEYLASVPADHALHLYQLLPKERSAEMFAFLAPELQEQLMESMDDDEKNRVLSELLEAKQYLNLKDHLEDMDEEDIADFLEPLPEESAVLAYQVLDEEDAAAVLPYLSPEQQEQITSAMDEATDKTEKLTELLEGDQHRKLKGELEDMTEAEITDFMETLPEEDTVQVYQLLPKEKAADVFAFLDDELQDQVMEGIDEEEKYELLNSLLEARQYRELKEQLVEMNEADIAEFLDPLSQERTVLVYRMLPKDLATDVFALLDPEQQEQIIHVINDAELKTIVEDLYVDDAVDMLEELPATVVRRVLKNTTPETRKLLNQFLQYPENSAGSVMTAEYVQLRKNMTVRESFDHIRQNCADKETIYICYVTDLERHLEGVVTVRDLLMNDYETKIGDIMDDNVIKAVTTDDQEEVADSFTKYDLLSIPVVDHENRLVGIVTVDDALDVMEDEATEDMEMMAAITPSEKTYMRSSVFDIFRSRVPWLILLCLTATFTGMIISFYESQLGAMLCLTAFIPMLMGCAGNAGSQSSVIVIRGLSLDEIRFSDMFRVIWKELRVGLCCGAAMALVTFLKVMLVDHLLLQTEGITVMVALVVSLTLLVAVLIAKLVGCTLPLIAQKIGFDPAVMASPFITTIVDAISLLTYFQIACMLLPL